MRRPLLILFFCMLSAASRGQSEDPKQAICQASWERCLGTGGGKNWKPIYDRCLKARTACLGGRSYQPDVPQTASSVLPNGSAGGGSPSDSVANANADPATLSARCENNEVRGARAGCV